MLFEYERTMFNIERKIHSEKLMNVTDLKRYWTVKSMLKKTARILIVDDDSDILTAGKLLLRRHFDEVVTTTDPANIPEIIRRTACDVILLDMNYGPGESNGLQGLGWIQKILGIDPDAVIIAITAHGGLNIAVEAMKAGATDFISKPWQNEKLVATLSSSVKLRQSRENIQTLKSTNKTAIKAAGPTPQAMLGQSPALTEVMHMVNAAAPTHASILILGENGTGKELLAREIHRRSALSEEVFMTVDLGSISPNLFESELFGHRKGAFTDARQDRIGLFEAADGGTLFLDEIGNVPLHLQSKLLTALEQRKITPVGANTSVNYSARIIAATNLSKKDLTDQNKFRQDLLFRVNTVEITLPPLRDRGHDVIEIADYFAKTYTKKYNRPAKSFSGDAINALLTHKWPGNIRELRHATERAVIINNSAMFEAIDFLPSQEKTGPEHTKPHQDADQTSKSMNNSPTQSGPEDGASLTDFNLARLEKSAISQALRKHHYNISNTAKDLGLTRAALYRRMEKHGL